MNTLHRLKAQVVGAGERVGKGVELLRERVGIGLSDDPTVPADRIRDGVAQHDGGGDDSTNPIKPGQDARRAVAARRFRDAWQTYVHVVTARADGGGEKSRLKQLAVVLQAYDAVCAASGRSNSDTHRVSFRMQLGGVLGAENSFCAEFAAIACAEMEKLEWQLAVEPEDEGFEDALPIHTPQSDDFPIGVAQERTLGAPGMPSLLQCLQVLLSTQWSHRDLSSFEQAGLLDVLISVLSDRVHVDGCPQDSGEAGGRAESSDDAWEPSHLDEALWLLTGRLLLHTQLVRRVANVGGGQEAFALLFDMASLDARSCRQRWYRGQALSSLKLILDNDDSVLAMAEYLQAYGCIGKVLQRLAKTLAVSWNVEEIVHTLGAAVAFVHALAPVSAKLITDFEHCGGCALLRRVIVWIQSEVVAFRACDMMPQVEQENGSWSERDDVIPSEVKRDEDTYHLNLRLLRSAVVHLGTLVILNNEPSLQRHWEQLSPASGMAVGEAKGAENGASDEDETGAIGGKVQLLGRKLGSLSALDMLVAVFEESVIRSLLSFMYIFCVGVPLRCERVYFARLLFISNRMDTHSETRQLVVDVVGRIYAQHPSNYHLLCGDGVERPRCCENSGLARLIRSADVLETSVTESMMQTVQQLAAFSGPRPLPELRAVAQVLSKNIRVNNLSVICRCIGEVVSTDSSYRDVFRELGLVASLVRGVAERYACATCSGRMSEMLQWDAEPDMRLEPIMIETLQALTRGSRGNSQLVRLRGLPCFLQLVRNHDLHAAVLKLLCQVAASGDHDDVEACVAGLCEVLLSRHPDSDDDDTASCTITDATLTCELLLALSSMVESEAGVEAFRLYGGFQVVLAILHHHRQSFQMRHCSAFENADSADIESRREQTARVVAGALSLLSVASHESPRNHGHLWRCIGMDTLQTLIEDTQVIAGEKAPLVLQSLLGMACGRSMCLLNLADTACCTAVQDLGNESIKAMTWKAEALVLLIGLCRAMSSENASRMLRIVSSIATARPDNAQELGINGAIKYLLHLLVRGPEDGEVREQILEIIATIGSVHLRPIDARRLLKLCWRSSPWRSALLSVMLQISQSSGHVSASYIRFSMEVHGYASAEMHVEKDLVWPPSGGYTVAFWVYIEKFGKGPMHLLHLYAQAKNTKESHNVSVVLNRSGPGQLSMHVGGTGDLYFDSVTFESNTWYHISLVHVQNKLQTSEASLFVNGQLRQTGKLRMGKITSVMNLIASPPMTDLIIFLGLPNNVEPKAPSEMQWAMGGVVLVEEPLATETILAMSRCGYSYDGCYQSETLDGDTAVAVATACRYAAIDSPDCQHPPTDQNRAVGKVPWDKLVFASKFLDRSDCERLVRGLPVDVQKMLGRGGVQNLKQHTHPEKLGWMRGDATVVSGLTFGDSLRSVGGVAIILALIETCSDSAELVTLLKILKGTLWRNALNLADMTHVKGYEVVAGFLQRRPSFITEDVVDEIMHIAGFGQSLQSGLLANIEACEHLILDIRMWRDIDPLNAAKVLRGLQGLLADGIYRDVNASVLDKIGLISFLCFYMDQPHVDVQACSHVTHTLQSFLDAVTVRVEHLHMLAQFMLSCESTAARQKVADGLHLHASGTIHRTEQEPAARPWLRELLITTLLWLVKTADTKRLAVVCASFEPIWFALMIQQSSLESILALLHILTVLLAENEAFCKAFRRANLFLLIGSQLDDFHWSSRLYVALIRLMFAAHVKREVVLDSHAYSTDNVSKGLALADDAIVTVPETLPLILRLLRANIQLEVALRASDVVTSPVAETCVDDHRAKQMLTSDAVHRPSVDELSVMNCVTVQVLQRFSQQVKQCGQLFMNDDVFDVLVGLMFLVNDDICTHDELGPTGAVSKMTGAVIKGLSTLTEGVGWMATAKAAAASAAKAAAASAAAAPAAALQGAAHGTQSGAVASDAGEDDGWEDIGDDESSEYGSLDAEKERRVSLGFTDLAAEKERRVSLGFTDVEHVATVPPVLPAAEDGGLHFHSSAGELVFQTLCQVVECGIWTPGVGARIVGSLLEAIPLTVPADEERAFGGLLLSHVCKLLSKKSGQLQFAQCDMARHLVAFTEIITDFVCADCFTVNHRDFMDFVTILLIHLHDSDSKTGDATGVYPSSQDAGQITKHLSALHKTTNRVILHLLSRLQQAPELLSSFVAALGDHVHVIFSLHNTDAPMIVLIALAVFGFFLSADLKVRHGAMRVWGHLLEHRRAVMLPLLSYHDAEGALRSLYTDGFSRLVVNGEEMQGDAYDAAVAVAIADFDDWLCAGPPAARSPGKRTVGSMSSTRCARVAAIVHDNAVKQRVKVGCLEQQYHADVQKRLYKSRQHRLQRIRKRMSDDEEERAAVQSAAQEVESKAVAQWLYLARSRWQNLESRSVFTRQQWTRDKLPLLRERGVLGQRWSSLEDCAWRTHHLSLEDASARQSLHTNAPAHMQGQALSCARAGDAAFLQRPSVVTWLLASSVHTARPRSRREGASTSAVSGPGSDTWMWSSDAERGLEGGEGGFQRLWWRLDETEGPQRMRRRLELDVLESSNPRYQLDETTQRFTPIKHAHKRQRSRGAGGLWEANEETLEPDAMTAYLRYQRGGEDGSGRRLDKDKGGLVSSLMSSLLGPSDAASGSGANVIDHDKFIWLLDGADDILAIHNCIRLFSGATISGVLLVCTQHVYVFDHCQVLATGEVRMFAESAGQVAAGNRTAPGAAGGSGTDAGWEVSEMAFVHRWSHAEIRDLQRRKYLLRPVGIEMFTADGLDCLLIFHKSERDSVYDSIMAARHGVLAKVDAVAPEGKASQAPQPLGEAALDLTDVSQTSELAQGRWTGRSSRKTLLHNLRRLWQDGDISNLQYLMHLNTLAGRSYNDLTQYPIFPWVLRDYSSTTLDLSNPATFRDLAKPMGAQDEARAQEYRKRFDNWVVLDAADTTPPFHYATHYSSAAAVTFFLIRLEPFTTAHVQLQGGKLDHADRIFSSVRECWESASSASLSDVKELIPEFYYMPDLFVNGNRLELGTRQKTGRVVDDVVLPPWAHDSADEFVRKMRMALESEYVSAHLHEWIDLIFGFRQRGAAAVEALNVFHHLSYEGNVDVDAITDPVQRMSTIAQILNFGQTPTQLFDKPHPPREACVAAAQAPLLCTDPSAVETSLVRDAWRAGDGPVRHVRRGHDGKVMVVSGERVLCLPAMHECFSWGHGDGSLRLVSLPRPSAAAAFASLAKSSESEKVLASYESLRPGVITVAATSEDGRVLVSGSSFGDLVVWRQQVRAAAAAAAGTTIGAVTAGIQAVRGAERMVPSLHLWQRLCAHTGEVTCLTVSNTHAVMLSGSADGTVLLWDTRRLRFMRQLLTQLPAKPVCIDLSQTGSMVVVAAGREFRVVNINGTPLGRVVLPSLADDAVLGARMVRAPEWAVEHPVIVSGHANGAVRFWRLLPKALCKGKASPDGAGASGGGICEAVPGEEKLALDLIFACNQSHQRAVTCISFSADGHQMLTGDAGGTVMLWGKDRKTAAASHCPKWLQDASRAVGRAPGADARLLRGIVAEHTVIERAEAEGGAMLVPNDFAPDVYVFSLRLSRPRALELVNADAPPAPSDISWTLARTYAQFLELHLLLQRHGGVASAVLPPKKPSAFSMAGRDSEDERHQGLASFISACLRQCTVRQAAILCAFIQAPEAVYELSRALLSQESPSPP